MQRNHRIKTRFVIATMLVGVLSCDYKPKNQGKAVYLSECASCHMEKGQGLADLIPPVANADFVVENRSDLACIIRHGIAGEIEVNGRVFNGEMQGNSQLSEVEISNLVHYILVEMNEQNTPFTINEIRAQLNRCE